MRNYKRQITSAQLHTFSHTRRCRQRVACVPCPPPPPNNTHSAGKGAGAAAPRRVYAGRGEYAGQRGRARAQRAGSVAFPPPPPSSAARGRALPPHRRGRFKGDGGAPPGRPARRRFASPRLAAAPRSLLSLSLSLAPL